MFVALSLVPVEMLVITGLQSTAMMSFSLQGKISIQQTEPGSLSGCLSFWHHYFRVSFILYFSSPLHLLMILLLRFSSLVFLADLILPHLRMLLFPSSAPLGLQTIAVFTTHFFAFTLLNTLLLMLSMSVTLIAIKLCMVSSLLYNDLGVFPCLWHSLTAAISCCSSPVCPEAL